MHFICLEIIRFKHLVNKVIIIENFYKTQILLKLITKNKIICRKYRQFKSEIPIKKEKPQDKSKSHCLSNHFYQK